MKLLVSCGTLMSGGAERVLSVLSKSFTDKFDEVVYLTWIDAPDFYPLDSRIIRICVERECGSKSVFKKALWFRNHIKRNDYSLILSFLEPFNVLICLTLTGLKTPIIVADRNDPRWVWNSFFQKQLRFAAYRKAKRIVCQTENNRSYYKGSYLEKSTVIYNPIFLPESYKGKALAIPKEHRFVSVARLDEQKNLKMMVSAFERFHKNHSNYTLTIYGEGPCRSELEELIKNRNLEDCVSLPGAKQNVWDLIINAEGFVLSSWYEGMPNALFEAMCLGLPCVSTKVSGAKDLIEDGYNGLLVDLGDENSLTKCLTEIAEDNEKSRLMGENATKVFDLLQLNIISKKWVGLFEELL